RDFFGGHAARAYFADQFFELSLHRGVPWVEKQAGKDSLKSLARARGRLAAPVQPASPHSG
ncbi:MAG TPA: hypothetical protein VLG17_09635, partial [Pseudomonas sp.]|uniref:hypothetical protein n=1 Tax=Pseudomonas sp. TaxID=306 RepID=UPI002C7C60DC